MPLPTLTTFSTGDLLLLYANVLDELRSREVLRSKNNPVADYGEGLACKAFNLKLTRKSTAGHDATDVHDLRYEVKCRRITSDNPSRQLSVFRNLDRRHFDVLIGIVFDAEFQIVRACRAPHQAVVDCSARRKGVNGHILHLRNSFWDRPGVEDVTTLVQAAASS